jgi:hypothetical protein
MRVFVLVLVTLVTQRILSIPGFPAWTGDLLLPTVFIVAPPLSHKQLRWPTAAILLGLGWDLLLEEVVGPGAIAWSASAVAVAVIAGVIADRSAKAWAAMGAVAVAVFLLARHVALLPLGLASAHSWISILRQILLSAGWCGLVGWILHLDLPARWRRHRARVLR